MFAVAGCDVSAVGELTASSSSTEGEGVCWRVGDEAFDCMESMPLAITVQRR